jgi:hypothetical protein
MAQRDGPRKGPSKKKRKGPRKGPSKKKRKGPRKGPSKEKKKGPKKDPSRKRHHYSKKPDHSLKMARLSLVVLYLIAQWPTPLTILHC